MSKKTVEALKTVEPIPAENKISLGWREWVALPDLDINRIKAKVDTGARTSCLHTFRTEPYTQDGERRVRFWVHPVQNDMHQVVECDARVLDEREVTDSGGHKELRLVIETTLVIGGQSWPVEMTLTNRDTMRFRMLIGRTAMEGRSMIYPEASYLAGEPALRPEK
ncbi:MULTISPECIES: ATP-dependent zinc protease family protein [Marinobacter]|uniref:ATP-dependent zinc protease n=1 Tax=Marinobacter xiaoshiensis TaxID=3073652 RepID=A0ABU2HLC2_9GAMM|nr:MULTISPECIES: ATP-dependent zinc protease [unclassified Marinobacter]MBK1872891.1 ATP-dependent zinc protease [Marinobacter sp. 1-3A]MBK1886968.1 ATP-dependent zinc protease [Marinobacter sp. DY40_1A1]MDS1311859.1 ATP-dependent zinc protease [Marinobacter sp. F60267]